MDAQRGMAPSLQQTTEEDEEINIYLKVIKTVSVKVKKSDTVQNVKAMVNDKEGISECLQEIFYNGHKLPNDQKLDFCGIKKDSTLQLFVQNMVPMRLFIKAASDQKVIVVNVKTCDTIRNIKCLIEAKERVHSEKFSLVYAGKSLEDDKTLAYLNIHGESTLHMVLSPRDVLPISVKMPSGEVLKMEVKILYTVRDVKAIIESIVGSPVNKLCLTYGGKQLDDSKVLSFYNIAEESTLEMATPSFQIFIRKGCGKTITLDVCEDDLVKNVKDKIFRKLGMPDDVQRLVFQGKVLRDCRNLASYNLLKDCTINLALCSSSTVMKLSAVGFSVHDLQSLTTISLLKTMIQNKMSAPPVKALYIDGVLLQDHHTFYHCRINTNTLITIVWKGR